MIVHHTVGVDMAVLPLFFVLKAIVDTFHVEVFDVGVLEVELAIMAPPVEVDIRSFRPELEGTLDSHGVGVKQGWGRCGDQLGWR
jgi:hypothetical protein